MGVKAFHRLSMQDWLPGRQMGMEGGDRERGQEGEQEETEEHLPGRSRSDEKDKDNKESAHNERVFPGRLESYYFKYSSLLYVSNCST